MNGFGFTDSNMPQQLPSDPPAQEAPQVRAELEGLMANWSNQAFGGGEGGLEQDPEVLALQQEQKSQAAKPDAKAGEAKPAGEANRQPESQTGSQPESPAEPELTPEQKRARELLADPLVQQLIQGTQQAELARQQQQQQAEAARLQQEQWEAYLEQLGEADPKEYVRITKGLRSQAVSQAQMREQIASEFYYEGYQQVTQGIPELKSLPADVSNKVAEAKTYAEAMHALVDHAANRRAEKLAEKLAEDKIEAFKADWTAKKAREMPVPPSQAAGRVGTNQTNGYQGNPLDGTAMLVAAFGEN